MPSRKRHRQPKQPDTLAAAPVGTTLVWHIDTPEAVPRLVEEVFSTGRYRPLLVVSTSNDTHRPRVDVDALTAALDEAAAVAVIGTGQTAWAFSHAVPDHFRAYGGGVRLYWPYAERTDTPDRHPLFLTPEETDSPRTVERILRTLREKGYLPEPDQPVIEAPWAREPVGDPNQDKVDKLLADLSAANDRVAALAAENTDLRKQVRGLGDQVAALTQRLYSTQVYTDPEAQLRHEIEHAWLHTYNEADRATHPLAPYTFGPDFLTSVQTIEGVDRDKVVSTCVDVLTRRAWEVNGRQARQMRSTAQAGAPYLTRATDGASAWRCNVQTATAQARRLMWWEVPDGTIELAVVALHDDTEIR